MCCFLSLLSPLFLISPCQGQEEQASVSQEGDQRDGVLAQDFLPFGERGYFRPSFVMDHLLALWPLLLLASLVNLWSLVSWPLSKEATGIYTLTEFNKAPLLLQSLCPHVSFFLYLSIYLSIYLSMYLFLADSLECESQLHNPGNTSLLPSFTFSLSTPDHQVLVQ